MVVEAEVLANYHKCLNLDNERPAMMETTTAETMITMSRFATTTKKMLLVALMNLLARVVVSLSRAKGLNVLLARRHKLLWNR